MRSSTTSASPTTTTDVGPEHEEEVPRGPARATVDLGPAERARLGLPDASTEGGFTGLAPLDESQWADPEAVAGRFAVVRTNYDVADDPEALQARTSPYVVARFDEDLATSSGATAGLADLRAQNTGVAGDVVGLVTSERSENRAVVDLTLRRSVTGEGPQHARVEFWRVTLVREIETLHWLVADLERS